MASRALQRCSPPSLTLAIPRGLPLSRAAKMCGISGRTISRKLKDPAFRAEVDKARASLVERASGRLSSGMTAAAETLHRLLKSENESLQLAAARAILEFSLRCRE